MNRALRIASGTGLLIAGILMLALPGPGIITIAAGLAVLSKDIPAAGRAADWVKAKTGFAPEESPDTESDSDQAGG